MIHSDSGGTRNATNQPPHQAQRSAFPDCTFLRFRPDGRLRGSGTIHFAGGGDTETNRLEVNITRLEWVGNAPFMVNVQPDSLASTLEGIPFDAAFTPALPKHSRIMARKAARLRVEFDGWVLRGDVHIVEYRYGSTTYDVEHEGL